MNPEDVVWNRACAEAGGPKSLTAHGDRALADMLLAHSLAMSGGLLHAVETLDVSERSAAIAGYRFFGLDAAADVLEDIARAVTEGLDDAAAEELEVVADERYAAVVADDEVLVSGFADRFRAEPAAFAAP